MSNLKGWLFDHPFIVPMAIIFLLFLLYIFVIIKAGDFNEFKGYYKHF